MKRIKPLFLLLLLLVGFLIPVGMHTASADWVTKTEPKVYITDYGDKYHSYDCQYLYDSKTAIGLYKAKDEGYTACSICGGKSNGTIQEKYFSNDSPYTGNSNYYSPFNSSTYTTQKDNPPSVLGIIGMSALLIAGGGAAIALLGKGLDSSKSNNSPPITSLKFWGMLILTIASIVGAICLFANGIKPWGYFLIEISICLFSLTFLWDIYS